jgi:amino acid permease
MRSFISHGSVTDEPNDDCVQEVARVTGGGLTKNEAIANFVIACVGSGVVVFPRAMADLGLVLATGLFLMTSAVCYLCANLVVTCCTMAEEAGGKKKGSLVSYEAMVEASLGTVGKNVLMVSKNCYCCGLIIVYLLFESDAFATWIPMSSMMIRFTIVVPVFIVLSMLKDLKSVALLSSLGVAAAFAQVICMEAGAIDRAFAPPEQTYKLVSGNLGTIGASTATFVFAFGSIATIPSIRSQMANADELPGALRVGFAIVCAIYGSIMYIGYWGFGNAVSDNMIDDINNKCGEFSMFRCAMGSGSAISIIVNLFISAPTFMLCVVSVFQASGKSPMHTPMTWQNVVFRALFVVILSLVSAVVPYAKQIIGLLSAVFGVCNIIIFPMASFYSLKRKLGPLGPLEVRSAKTLLQRSVHILVCVIGGVTMVFGVYGALKELHEKITADHNAA